MSIVDARSSNVLVLCLIEYLLVCLFVCLFLIYVATRGTLHDRAVYRISRFSRGALLKVPLMVTLIRC